MFHDLLNFKKESYFREHQEIIIYTPEKEIFLQPIAVVCTEADGRRRITDYADRAEFQSYVTAMLEGGKYREEPWEVWLQFGKDGTTITSGRYEIPYERHEHEETFKRNYKIKLIKYDSETGKPLENSDFEILEQFDFSQLDGTNLEEEQFREDTPAEQRFCII